jgi:Ca-activated chloride channel family protein
MNEDGTAQLNPDGTPMTLVDYMNQLELAPEPAPISLWPQTGGWIWLGLALLALVVWGLMRWRRARRESLYRRQALGELAGAGNDPAAIATILRRTALAGFSRSDVASLQGNAGLTFLDRTYGGDGFSGGPGAAIVRVPYAPTRPVDGLASLAERWIRGHREPPGQAAP